MTFRLSLPENPYGNEDRVGLFAANLENRLREEPGVSSVAFALSLPPNLLAMSNNYTVEDRSPDSRAWRRRRMERRFNRLLLGHGHRHAARSRVHTRGPRQAPLSGRS